ncbi:unnamed protein product [Effrenium voratum]|nr:unnamed protein product [Effrenium voratum]
MSHSFFGLQKKPRELTSHRIGRRLTNEDGEVLYYHTQERKLQKVHPLILRYQEVYFKARSYTKQLESGQIGNLLEQTDAKMAAITASVMGRASKGLPPATPEVVESLARVLGVESKKEFFLFRVVKQTIEAYVEKKLDLSSVVQDDLKDPMEFLRQIRKKQNQVDVIRKPTTVVMCQECENRAAVLKCEQCKDYFCQEIASIARTPLESEEPTSHLTWSSWYVLHSRIALRRASACNVVCSTPTRASCTSMPGMLPALTCATT